MINDKIRAAITNYAQENDEQIYFFENPSFDNSIIGITEDHRLIYDYEKMINELSEEDEIDLLDAEEFIQYNTLRALPYMNADAPIILMYNTEHLKEFYGND